MKIQFYALKKHQDISSDISEVIEKAKQFSVQSIEITQNVHNTANAKVSIYHQDSIDTLMKMNYCMIICDQKQIFIGKIKKQTFLKYTTTLIANSEPNEEEIQKAFDLSPISKIFNKEQKVLRDILLFDSKMNVYNLNQYKSTIFPLKLKDSTIYEKEYYKPHISKKSNIKLNIKWIESRSHPHEISNKLNESNKAELTMYMKKRKDIFPMINKKFGKYTVTYNSNNDLWVKSNIELRRSETWNFNTHINNLKDLNIYLDGRNYVLQYEQWEVGKKYFIGDKVTKKNGVVYQCIKDHKSDSMGNYDYWIKYMSNTACHTNKHICLFGTNTGKDIFQSFIQLLHCYIEKNGYNYTITVSGPWENWAFIEIMNQIRFKDYNNNEQFGRINSYEKIWKQGKKYVKFVIYFSEYKQPELTQIECYAADYFEDEYIDKSIFETHKQFLLTQNNIQASDSGIHEIYDVSLLKAKKKKKSDNKENHQEITIQGIKLIDKIQKKQHIDLNFELYRKEQQ